jgi:fibronectin type 3 domain-containing protein
MIAAMFGTLNTAEAATAWDGTTKDTGWYTANTYNAYYTLSTGAQLAGLAQLTNAGNDFKGKTIILSTDIDLGSHTWTPIGTDEHPFNGTFDGGSHKVSGLAIGTSDAYDTAFLDIGLFGCTNSNAILKNINADVAIYSVYSGYTSPFAGGIVGVSYGIVINCFTTGSIYGKSTNQLIAGGIAGEAEDGRVENCGSRVNITSTTLGGVVGISYYGFNMINCYATGTITKIGSMGNAGGICSYAYSGQFTNCYFNRDIYTPAIGAGGGTQNNVTGLTTAQMKGADVSIIYYNASESKMATKFVEALNGGTGAIPALSDGSPVERWDIDGTNEGYPVLRARSRTLGYSINIGSAVGATAITAAAASGDSIVYNVSDILIVWPNQMINITDIDAAGFTSGADISAAAGQYIGLYEINSYDEIVAFNCVKLTANDIRRDIDLPGKGTAADPFRVSSAANLQNLQTLVEGGKTYVGKTIILTKDIDLSGVTDWKPIGSYAGNFSGVFDGKGYRISNLSITGGEQNEGLFGFTSNTAVIKNILLFDINIHSLAEDATGGIVAHLNGGSITNCAVTGSITVAKENACVGGLAGWQTGGTITNCSAAVTVIGTNDFSGGLAGYIESNGSVKNCFARGDVTDIGSNALIGGFAGYANSTITNCYATGNVSGGAGTTYAGGFVGYSSGCIVKNCYATGNVAVTSGNVGGLSGYSASDTFAGCYWNSSAGQSVNSAKQDPKRSKGNDIGSTANGMTLANMQTAAFASTLNKNISSLSLTSCKAWKQAAGINGSLPYLTDVGSVPAISASISAGTVIGSTKITAAASSGNSLKYVVSSSSLGTPVIPDTLGVVAPAAKAYTSGANISGVSAGKYIGLYEVNTGGVIQKFKLITLATANIKTLLAPASFKAVPVSYNSIKLTWSAATGAAGYEISRATASTGAYSVVGTPTATNFTNTNLTMGSTYYYKARSYVLESGKKVYSAYTSVISIKAAVPAPGSVKAASASYNSVKITWAATSGATGYEVWRADTSGGTYKLIKAVTALNYTNTSLTTGKTYYYKVKAYRKAGTAKVYGSYSSAVSAKPVPAVPGSFKAAKASASSIKLSWSSVSGANGYMIYRATSSAGKYTLIKTLTSKTYTDTKLTKNKTYYYKVCAYKTVSGKKICGLFTAIKSAKPY